MTDKITMVLPQQKLSNAKACEGDRKAFKKDRASANIMMQHHYRSAVAFLKLWLNYRF